MYHQHLTRTWWIWSEHQNVACPRFPNCPTWPSDHLPNLPDLTIRPSDRWHRPIPKSGHIRKWDGIPIDEWVDVWPEFNIFCSKSCFKWDVVLKHPNSWQCALCRRYVDQLTAQRVKHFLCCCKIEPARIIPHQKICLGILSATNSCSAFKCWSSQHSVTCVSISGLKEGIERPQMVLCNKSFLFANTNQQGIDTR